MAHLSDEEIEQFLATRLDPATREIYRVFLNLGDRQEAAKALPYLQ